MHQLSNVHGRGRRVPMRAPENHAMSWGSRADSALGMGVTEVRGDGTRQIGLILMVLLPSSLVVLGAHVWAAP